MQDIDVDDWERNTIYRHYNTHSKQIQWFWKVCRKLYQFVKTTHDKIKNTMKVDTNITLQITN